MERKIKAALTTLNNDLGDNDVIIITKNKALYESNNYEYDDTWKINNDIDVLREAGLQKIFDQEDSESSTTTTTKKKRTPNASQITMYEKIKNFFKENECKNGDEKEDFNGISVNFRSDKSERINFLQNNLLPSMKGSASSALYRTFIEFFFLIKKYKENLDDDENDIDGEENLKNEVKSIIKTNERPYLFLKKCKNFHKIVSKCKKNSWKNCNIPPSYWRDINIETWGELLRSLGIEGEVEV